MRSRRGGRAGLLVLAACGLIILARTLPETAPGGDFALTDIQVRNVVRGWQGVGPYSRTGGFHPGPLYFQTLAPLHVLADYRHAASVLTVLAINVASAWGILAIVRRRATHASVVFALALVFGFYLWRMDGLLTSVWNPHVGILPSVLTLVVAAAIVSRATIEYLPIAVIAGSFAIQTHISFAVPVGAALGIIAIALLAFAPVRAALGRRPRPLVVACLLAGLVWAMPLVDQYGSGGHHNLSRIYEFAVESTPHDPRQAARAFEHLLVSPFTPGLQLWDMSVPAGSSTVRTLFNLQLGLILFAMLWFYRQRLRFELALTVVVVAAGTCGLLAMRRIPEPVHAYTVLWVTALGALAWSLILTAMLDVLRFRPAALRFPRGVALVAAALFLVVLTALVWRQTERDLIPTPPILALSEAVAVRLQAGGMVQPHFRIRSADLDPSAGVILALDKRGLQPTVESPRVPMFGDRFRASQAPSITFELADWDRHFEDLKYRTDYVRTATAGRVVLYEMAPVPVLDEQPIATREVGRSPGANTRIFTDERGERLMFAGSGEFVDWHVDRRAMALELRGQAETTWQIRCVSSSAEVSRIGRVTIGRDDSSGPVFLRDLPSCPTVRISPVDGLDSAWLTSIRFLATH